MIKIAAIDWKTLFKGLIGALAGMGSVLGYLYARDLIVLELPTWPVSILSMILAVTLSVFVHEAGHLIAGLTQKFRFLMFSVGPFKIDKMDGNLKPGINKNLNVAGGLTLMIPKSENYKRNELAWFIAGGPIASLLLFITGTALALSLYTFAEIEGNINYTVYFSWLTAIISLLLFVTSIIPEQGAGLESDGHQLLDLFTGGDLARIKQFVMQLSASSWSGTRPKDLDANKLYHLIELIENQNTTNAFIGKLILYLHKMDTNEIASAGDILDEMILMLNDHENQVIGPAVYLEKCFYEAMYNGDAEKAKSYFKKGKEGFHEKNTLNRADAALSYIQKDYEQAIMKAENGLNELENSFDIGGAKWERDVFYEILKKSKNPIEPSLIKEALC